MHQSFRAALIGVVLSVPVAIDAAEVPPVPENPREAQTSLGFNPKTRCPDLRITDAGTIAVVVFWLPRSGIPSRISIKASSGSSALDSATIRCVSQLRFAAATTLGDGDPVDSWQQIAFGWAGQAADPIAPAPAGSTAPRNPRQSGGDDDKVTVRVCVDATGKLQQDPTIIRSSGIASLDQAAARIASAGSAFYRPDTAPTGPAPTGCAQLTIQFDVK
jgi:TonB family protein